MSNDFSSKQIRVSQLIASGGIAVPGRSWSPGLVVYSASNASDLSGGIPASLLADLSSDVFVFVSGSKDGVVRGEGVTLFGGDVVVSGTLYAEKQVVEVDENVTGSLTVQGSMFVSSSATVAGGLTVNQDAGGTTGDGIVVKGSVSGRELFRANPGTNTVLILSGGSEKSFNQSEASGISFFVSGGMGPDFDVGVSLFGGDVFVSGGLRVEGEFVTISDSIDHMGDPDTFLKFDTDKITLEAGGKNMAQLIEDGANNRVLILSGGSDKAYDESSGNDIAFYVSGSVSKRGTGERGTAVFGGDLHVSGAVTSDTTNFGQWTDAGAFLHPDEYSVESVIVGGNSLGGADILLAVDGGAVFNEQSNSVDFRVESNNKTHALVVSGSTDQVLILSGGSDASYNEASGGDVALYVSGAVGRRGFPDVRGTSVFGGDVYVSGTHYASHITASGDLTVGNELKASGDLLVSQYIIHDGDGNTKLDFTDDKLVFTIGGRRFIDMTEASTDTIEFNALQSSNFTFIVNNSSNEMLTINDTEFVVNEEGAPDDFRVESNTKQRAIYVDGDNQFIQLLEDTTTTPGSDAALFVSGGIGSKLRGVRGVSVFGGDVVISGSLYGGSPLRVSGSMEVTGTLSSTLGISGSITNLVDGTSYLAAGANITITSASNGQISIAAAETNPGGSDTQLQYNSNGSFGGISGATTDGSSVTFSDNAILVSENIIHAGDTDTKITFGTDAIRFDVGGKELVNLNEDESTIAFNSDSDAINTVIHTDTKLAIAAGTPLGAGKDQVLIMSGGSDASFNEAAANDVLLYVSGAVGSRGTANRGTSVFGGDVVVSGTLSLNQSAAAGSQVFVTTQGRVGIGTDAPDYKLDVAGNIGLNEYIYHNGDTDTYIRFTGDDIELVAGGVSAVDAGTDQVLILSGGSDASYNEATGADVSVYVSGSRTQIGGPGALTTGRHTGQRTNTIFGGDVVFSGSIYGAGEISPGTTAVHVSAGVLQLDASTQIAFCDNTGTSPGFGGAQSTDTFFSVSGSIGSINSTSIKGVSVFGGDAVVSGSFRSGGQLHITTHKSSPGNSTAAYLRFDSDGSDSPNPGGNNKMVTPYNGRLVKVIARGVNAPGSTVIGFHRNSDGSAELNPTTTEDITVDMAAGNTAYTFNFTTAADWAAGDIVGLKVNPNSDPGALVVTAVWEFDNI